jgi:hypothetical protein
MFNFRLEEHLIERVDRVAPKGKRTEFVEQAIDEKLAAHEGHHPFRCPVDDCDYRARSESATCPRHGRRVVREGTLL